MDRFITIFAKAGLASVAAKLTGIFLRLLTAIVLARLLGPAGFGSYSYIIALAAIFAIPTQMGLPRLINRETARALAEKNTAKMAAIWRWADRAILLMLPFSLCAIIFFAYLYPVDGLDLSTVAWTIILIPSVAFANLRGAALGGLGKVVLGQMPDSMFRPLIFLLFVVFLLITNSSTNISPSVALALHSFAALISLCLISYFLTKFKPSLPAIDLTQSLVDPSWLRSSIFFGMTSGMVVITAYTDTIMLGIMASPEDTGIYRVAVSIATIATLVQNTLGRAAISRVVTMLRESQLGNLRYLLKFIARVSLVTSSVSLLILAVWGEELLSILFGTSFSDAYHPLIILLTGYTIMNYFGPTILALDCAGHEKDTFKGIAIGALLNITANSVLIPKYGASGAAISTACSSVAVAIFLFSLVRKRIGISSSVL